MLGQTSYLFVDKPFVWVIKIFIHIILQTSDSLISKVVSYIWEHSISWIDKCIFISQCYNLVWVDFVHFINLVEIIVKLFCNRKLLYIFIIKSSHPRGIRSRLSDDIINVADYSSEADELLLTNTIKSLGTWISCPCFVYL